MRKGDRYLLVRAAVVGLTALVLLGGVALAQETVGAIAGTATSEADGAPLPGVTITVKNDDTDATRTAQTDAQGRYRFGNLPVGSYTVTAALDGFQTLATDEVQVSLGATKTVNVGLRTGDLEETITVTSETPLIDVSSAVSGVSVNIDELGERVPIAREITQVAMLAPGTTTGDTAFDAQDRAYTPGQRLTSIGGASVGENTYIINGLNISNFRNGLGGSNVPFEFVKEVQVKTGGYEAEFGRSTGGVLNMVSRSGSNAFHGSANLYVRPEGLQEQSPDYFNGLNSEEFRNGTEFNVAIGGPIYRDRAFFFAFYQANDVENSNVSITRETVRKRDDPYYGGKIDLNITPSHRLEGTYFTDEVTVASNEYDFDADARLRGDLVGVGNHDAGGENIIGKYTGIFGTAVVFSGQYGTNDFNRVLGSSGDAFPAIWDDRGASTTFPGQWVNLQVADANDERTAARADLDFYVSSHSARLGVDQELNTSNDLTTYSGPTAEFPGGQYYRYFINGSRFPQVAPDIELVRFRQYRNGGSFDVHSDAYYAQDSWEINPNFLLNFGGRWESFDNENAIGESYIKKDNQFAPRVGLIWDPSGAGNSKVYANYGRYHLYIASNTNIRLAGAETFFEDWYVMAPSCDTDNPTNASCFGQVLDMNVFGDGEVPDVRATKSNDIDPMYQDEFMLGYEKMIGTKWSVGARGIYRIMDQAIEDITIDAALESQYPGAGFGAFEYRLVNPGSSFNGFVDLHDGNGLIPFSATAEELGYPPPERNYYAVDLTFNRRYSDNWMLQGSLTWGHSYGNYEGYVRSDNGQDDAGITTLYDFAGLMDGTYGNLPNDRRWNLKAFGAYQFDFGLLLGANLTFRSGRPENAFGVHPTDPFAALYGNESLYDETGTLVYRGSRGTTPDITNIDLTARYDIPTSGQWGLSVRADIFNLFDADSVVEIDEAATEESGSPNPTYLEGTRFQAPRGVRFGLVIRR